MSRRAAPRRLPFVSVKRNIPQFRDSYGHWWIEVDGTESYGWWSMRCPLSIPQVIVGTIGTLNGVGGDVAGGTPTTDPRHGEDADFAFQPLLLAGKSDTQVRDEIRAFAASYGGRWGWPWWWRRTPMTNCHTFQLDLFTAIGLTEGAELLYTRGPGCPFMFLVRRLRWRLADGLRAGIQGLVDRSNLLVLQQADEPKTCSPQPASARHQRRLTRPHRSTVVRLCQRVGGTMGQ